ncbi:MAG TPA: 30S ribosomal protein S18 [Candidatus Saccharimonadales bacterium]|nr:30S ribosomal protein S18 [Candidatus Saccharimonadales bacterium]
MAKIFKHKTDIAYFDYKDFKTLQRYVNQYGQIESRKKTGLSESQQKKLAVAIKRARHIGLLPFVQNG